MKRRKLILTMALLIIIVLFIGGGFGYYYSHKLSQSISLLEWRSYETTRADNIVSHVEQDIDRITFNYPVALNPEEKERLILESLDTARFASNFPSYYYTLIFRGDDLIYDEGDFFNSVFGCGSALYESMCEKRVSSFFIGNVTPSSNNREYANYIVNDEEYFFFARSIYDAGGDWNFYFVAPKTSVLATIDPDKNFSWGIVVSIFILFFAISSLVLFSFMRIWESEKKYGILVRNANDLIFVCDRKGNIVDVNPVAKKLLGRSIGKQNICKYILDKSYDIKKLYEMGKQEVCVEIEFAVGTKSAVLECVMSTVDIRGKDHLFIVARDITLRKQLEKRAEVIYALSHKLLKVDTLDEVCNVVISAVKDLIFFENVAVFMLNKYDQLYLRATNVNDVSFSENISNKKNLIYHAFEKGKMFVLMRVAKKKIDFLDKKSSVEAAIPLIAGGDKVGILFLGSRKRDFSRFFSDQQHSVLTQVRDKYLSVLASEVAVALKNIQYRNELRNWRDKLDKMVSERTLELKKANEELKHQDELKSEFVNIVGHELRTPLTSIRGFSEVLSDTSENLTEEQKEFLDVIRTETERLSELINDMLDVSKIEAGKLELRTEKFDIVNLLRSCPLYHQAKEKGLGVVFDFPKKSLKVYADKDRIQQVLINLVSNAIKFTENGKITIGFDVMRSRKIRVYIKDTGLGIDHHDMKHIFEKFYQSENHLRRSAGGSGLGLNISKQIIEMHKGKVSVTSKFGKGSEFSFIIPIIYKEEDKEGEEFATSIIDKYY